MAKVKKTKPALKTKQASNSNKARTNKVNKSRLNKNLIQLLFLIAVLFLWILFARQNQSFRQEAADCGNPGDVGNELGVGKYCTAGGSECSDKRLDCTLSYSSGLPAFCTKTCITDVDCGAGAKCADISPLRVCEPVACNIVLPSATEGPTPDLYSGFLSGAPNPTDGLLVTDIPTATTEPSAEPTSEPSATPTVSYGCLGACLTPSVTPENPTPTIEEAGVSVTPTMSDIQPTNPGDNPGGGGNNNGNNGNNGNLITLLLAFIAMIFQLFLGLFR